MSKWIAQVRCNSGALKDFDNLEEALNFNNGEWYKVSWEVGLGKRLILYSDGTWTWRGSGHPILDDMVRRNV